MRHHQRTLTGYRLVVLAASVGVAIIATAVRANAQTLKVTGTPATLRISSAAGGAGTEPASAVNATTTYTVKATRRATKKITVELDNDMPAGVTLTLSLAPPTGAASAPVSLTTTTTDAVTNITNTTNQKRAITYTLQATAAAGVVTSQNRRVTFTLVDYP